MGQVGLVVQVGLVKPGGGEVGQVGMVVQVGLVKPERALGIFLYTCVLFFKVVLWTNIAIFQKRTFFRSHFMDK